jgi:hypothetical protein
VKNKRFTTEAQRLRGKQRKKKRFTAEAQRLEGMQKKQDRNLVLFFFWCIPLSLCASVVKCFFLILEGHAR